MKGDFIFEFKMSLETVDENKFSISGPEDMYKIVLVRDDYDPYEGRWSYAHVTAWSMINDIDQFRECLGWFSDEDIISYRDDMDGNILSSLYNKSIDYFELVCEYIGDEQFFDMLLQNNRSGVCPLAEIRNDEAFEMLLKFVHVDGDVLRQCVEHGSMRRLNLLASMINYINEVDGEEEEDEESQHFE